MRVSESVQSLSLARLGGLFLRLRHLVIPFDQHLSQVVGGVSGCVFVYLCVCVCARARVWVCVWQVRQTLAKIEFMHGGGGGVRLCKWVCARACVCVCGEYGESLTKIEFVQGGRVSVCVCVCVRVCVCVCGE